MSDKVVSLNLYKMNYLVNGDESVGELLNFFETNFLNGKKNIAVSSTHYHSLQQKLILSVLQFFNKKYPNLKIGVISFSCDSGNFQEFTAHSSATKEVGINNFGRLFDLISWEYVLENKLEKSIAKKYDLVLWELPEMEKMVALADTLSDSLESIDAVFFISNRLSSQNDTDFREAISQYFLNHGVNISHLFSKNTTEAKKAS